MRARLAIVVCGASGWVVPWRPVTRLPRGATIEESLAEPCNVVLTTTNADFDSLAAACALAELWSQREPFSAVPTHVVLPRGALPSVARFLAYHKHVLPVRGFKTIDGDDVRALGVVDASNAARLGRATRWIDKAESVHVFDHHIESGGGLSSLANEYVVEAVGSTTTMMVEKLRDEGVVPGPARATLYVLGIRADTGGLAYESTTLRDAEALCWLLKCGASQSAVAEFSLDRVGVAQREALAAALPEVRAEAYRGIEIATVAVRTERYVSGLAQIAEELLALTAADVLLLAAVVQDEKKRTWIDLIGRARPRAVDVDLRNVMKHFGGGGHARAAAAPVANSRSADAVLEEARALVQAQIPGEVRAARFMTRNLVVVPSNSTIADARRALAENDLKSIPVVDADTRRLRGLLKLCDVVKAEKHRKAHEGVRGWMRTLVPTISPRATLAQIEAMLQSTGRLPVVDDDHTLLGIITRTDVLRIRNFYDHGVIEGGDSDPSDGDDIRLFNGQL
ncbi:hypothetical protein CTAYLR_006574 [Chrysophaeum taylorii]|uniref:CBS domain-containing protein n=1 Tax=Chrysophaeum taylorii TaxID=2483200 RepID=A0AAD7UNS3_9STRA|nr:hypothetical protein CTAYLR_006574 [Chrysophaeum taylorii]